MSSKHKYKGEWDGPVCQWTNTETGERWIDADRTTQELNRLTARIAELEAIVKRVLKDAPRCVCEEQHHSRLDYHETGDLCPVEWRWSSVTAAALTALRPSKRGPTPDNQKRKDG